jgi:carbohydrate-binding DOMON domain-containing protein
MKGYMNMEYYDMGRKFFYKFDGFDYSELMSKWNLFYDYNVYPIEDDYFLKEFIDNFIKIKEWSDAEYTRVSKRYIKDIREFCIAMSEWDIYDSSLWKGLAEIQDDYSFLRLFKPLLGYAWN